jgi:hypothetical protein
MEAATSSAPGLPNFYRYFPKGCQIFNRNTYQNGKKYTYSPSNIPNISKVDQIVIKYTNLYHCNLPKLEFFVWKNTIWQPLSAPIFGEAKLLFLHQKLLLSGSSIFGYTFRNMIAAKF